MALALLSDERVTEQVQVRVIRATLEGMVEFANVMVDKTMPPIDRVLSELTMKKREMEEEARNNPQQDHRAQFELNLLIHEFQQCIELAEGFIRACRDMAKFGAGEGIAKVIDRDLNRKQIRSLKKYTANILKKLAFCKERATTTKESKDAVIEKSKEILNKHRKDVNRRWYATTFAYKAASNLKYLGVLGTMGMGALWQRGYISGQSALVGGGLSSSLAVGLYCAERPLAYYAIDTERRMKEYLAKEAPLVEAEKCIVVLQKQLYDVMLKVDRFEQQNQEAERQIDDLEQERKEFKPTDQSNEEPTIELAIIKQCLQSFRDLMKAMLDQTQAYSTQEACSQDALETGITPTTSSPAIQESEYPDEETVQPFIAVSDNGGNNSQLATGMERPTRPVQAGLIMHDTPRTVEAVHEKQNNGSQDEDEENIEQGKKLVD